MPKLKLGSLIVDLVDGSIHGDLEHCPGEDLLESARALLSLLPQVQHKGLWGLPKAYDADCYLYTTDKRHTPPEGLSLEADCPWTRREFRLTVSNHTDREISWRYCWYQKPVGRVVEGRVIGDTVGVASHFCPPVPPPPSPRPARATQAALPL